jgi:hypothetical protein
VNEGDSGAGHRTGCSVTLLQKLAPEGTIRCNAGMNKLTLFLSVVAAASFTFSNVALAGGKTYQVTGPVLEMNDTSVTVQKGKEKWEIARDSSTKVTGDLKVGAKVTITYTMSATEVEVKAEKAGAKSETKKK